MVIAICGSIKFFDQMVLAQKKLEELGHEVFIPTKALEESQYWSEDNKARVEAKKKFEFIGEHFDKIEKSDAILVINVTKKETVNYIGANTFLEMGFAYYRKKKIFTDVFKKLYSKCSRWRHYYQATSR